MFDNQLDNLEWERDHMAVDGKCNTCKEYYEAQTLASYKTRECPDCFKKRTGAYPASATLHFPSGEILRPEDNQANTETPFTETQFQAGMKLFNDGRPASKPTNPKDLLGVNKVPFHLWPETASVLGAMALLDGALKYGRSNWRGVGVRASIYYDACRRHMNRWFEGEDSDPESGLPHLAHALACIAILVDSGAKGNLNDDRMYPGGFNELLTEMNKQVAVIREKYKDCTPHHYTKGDAL